MPTLTIPEQRLATAFSWTPPLVDSQVALWHYDQQLYPEFAECLNTSIEEQFTIGESEIWSPLTASVAGKGNCVAKSLAIRALANTAGCDSGIGYDGVHYWNIMPLKEDVLYVDGYYNTYAINGGSLMNWDNEKTSYAINAFYEGHSKVKTLAGDVVYKFIRNDKNVITDIQALHPKEATEQIQAGKIDTSCEELYIPPAAVVLFFSGFRK